MRSFTKTPEKASGHYRAIAACFVGAALAGCSTVETPPDAPIAPPAPILSMPHPAGADLADIRDLFYDKQAPVLDSLKFCDADFRKLQAATQSRDVLAEGMRELVRKDPAHYHWCFYSQILSMENALKGELYVDERQKLVLDTFEFLTPVARVFLTDYRDSRYLRWAIYRYQKLSEWVFFRRVEASPKETEELVNTANPMGLVRGSGDDQSAVLDRYGIGAPSMSESAPAPTAASAPAASADPGAATAPRAPASDSDSTSVSPPDGDFKPFSAIDPAQQSAPAEAPAAPSSARTTGQ